MSNGGLTFAVFTICLAATSAQRHNFSWGLMRPNDKLLFEQTIEKQGKPSRIVEQDFMYPPQGTPGNYTITGIRITDRFKNGEGGHANLIEFLPNRIKVHFKSQRGKPMAFLVQVFGT